MMNRKMALALCGLLLVASQIRSQDVPPAAPKAPSEVKTAFLKLLDRPEVSLDAKSREDRPATRARTSERVDFAVEQHADGTIERVPGLVVRPEVLKPGEKRPAILVLHGTGGTKEGLRSWLERLAGTGFVAISIDGRYHGERSNGEKGTKAYNEAIAQAWRAKPGETQTHPFYFDTCWDIWRTIDYLQSRPDVDPERIGMIGISKGGIETWLAGAVDERVKVAVPCIGVQSFRWSLEHDRWQARANTIKEAHEVAAKDLGEPGINARVCRELWSKIIPGILDEFDGPSMLRLFAGRSLLILSGDKDPNCPLEGAEIAFASARAAFSKVGRDDHLKIMVAADTGHSVTKEQQDTAVAWFVRWLKPTDPTSRASVGRISHSDD
jgi:dienelactone hydrolase